MNYGIIRNSSGVLTGHQRTQAGSSPPQQQGDKKTLADVPWPK